MNKFKIGDRAKVLAASNNIPNYSDHVGREYDVIDVSHYGDVKLSHSIFYHDPSWLEIVPDKLPDTPDTPDTVDMFISDWKAQSLHLATTTDMKWRAIARQLNVPESSNRDWLTSQIGSKKEWDKRKVEARVDKVVSELVSSLQAKATPKPSPERLKKLQGFKDMATVGYASGKVGVVEDNSRILVISDLHIPYHHPDAISFLRHLKDKYNPTRVICMGDELDHSALSYHDTDPDLYNAGDELARSLPFIQELKELFPVMDILDSNHGSMVWRKAKTHGIPRHYIKSYNDVLGVDSGWKWMFDLTIELPNGNKCYFHHGKSSDVVKLSQIMGMCAVQGHYHEKFKIDYWSNPIGLYWGLQTGCLISHKSLAFSYNNVNIKRPTIGTAVIINSQPILEPMLLDEDGRWIGI